MIKMKNCGDFILEFSLNGTQSTTAGSASGQASCIVPFQGRISAIFARMKTQGTTGTQTVDLLKNGTSLTGSNGIFNFPTTVGGASAPTYTLSNLTGANPPLVSKGDVISILNKTIHTGTAAQDLTVYVTLERQRSGSMADAIQTDTVGSDSDTI